MGTWWNDYSAYWYNYALIIAPSVKPLTLKRNLMNLFDVNLAMNDYNQIVFVEFDSYEILWLLHELKRDQRPEEYYTMK